MIKKIHWIEKTSDNWKLLLKIDDEIYRIRIITKLEYGVTYTLYKYERFNDFDGLWTADITKSETKLKTRSAYVVLSNIRLIYLEHIETHKPSNVIYTIKKDDGNSEKRSRINQSFLNDLEKLDYITASTNQSDFKAYIGIKKDTELSAKTSSFLHRKIHQIQFKMDDINF